MVVRDDYSMVPPHEREVSGVLKNFEVSESGIDVEFELLSVEGGGVGVSHEIEASSSVGVAKVGYEDVLWEERRGAIGDPV